MSLVALVRSVSPAVAECELTHLDRTPIDPARAEREHAGYVAALAAAGCRIEWLPPLPEHPDGVFVEDTAVVLEELAVITRPGAVSRRGETPSVAVALARYRPLESIPAPATLDGGDVMRVGRRLFVGLTARTSLAGAAELARRAEPLGYRVAALPVTGCLHLKSAVTPLDEETLLLNPDWVDPSIFAGFRLLHVDPAEPFAGNALALAKGVIHAAEFPRTRALIEAAGFPVTGVPAGELAKAEGGVTCGSLIVKE